MTLHIPTLVIDPRALSPEHLLLRRLNRETPTSLGDALRKMAKLHPDFTRLGSPERPTASARNAWFRLSEERWTVAVRHGERQGLVLTEEGERRLELFWELQVIRPYLSRIEHEFGPDVAREVARTL